MSKADISTAESARKRHRSTLVCNICKQRKVKCDLKLPCTSCVKYHTLQICSFNKALWTDEDQQQRSMRFLPDIENTSRGTEASRLHNRFPPSLVPPLREHQVSVTESRKEPPTDSMFADSLAADIVSKVRKELGFIIESSERGLGPTPPLVLPLDFNTFESAIGLNPYSDPLEKVNFYQQETLVSYDDLKMDNVAKSGPLSWLAVVRRDPAVADLLHFIHVRSRKFLSQDKATAGSNIPGEQNKLPPEHPNSPFQILTRIRKFLLDKFDPFRYKAPVPTQAMPLGLTYRTSKASDSGTVDGLRSILPPRKILWALVDLFFRNLYPYFPYLDEETFRDSVTQIFGTRNSRDITYAHISVNDQGYITVGTLCVVLRLSYLSLISNNTDLNRENMARETDNADRMIKAELLANPIGMEAIVFARSCVNRFQLLQKSTLELLQLVIFMTIYTQAAPEDAEGPERNQNIYVGILVQMGYALGLHREPDIFAEVYPNPRPNNLRRKIWLFLRYIDAVLAFTLSTPVNINDKFSDTKYPFLNEHNGNSLHQSLDYYTHEAMRPLEQTLPLMKDLMDLVLDINLVSMAVLTTKISQLEIALYHKFGTFKDFHKAFHQNTLNSDFSKMLQLPFFVSTKFHLAVFYFSLYSIFENSGEWKLAFYYFKKIAYFLAEEFIPYYLDLLCGKHFYLEHAYQLLLNLQISVALNKALGILFSFIIRVNYTAKVLETESSHKNKNKIGRLRVLSNLLASCSKIILIGLSKMEHRQSFAWKKMNMSSFVLKLVNGDYYKFRDAKDQKKEIPVLGFSDEQLDEVCHFIELIMTKHNLHKLVQQWSLAKETTDINKSSMVGDCIMQDHGPTPRTQLTPMSSTGISLTPREIPGSTTEASDQTPSFDTVNQAMATPHSLDFNHVMESFFQMGDSFLDIMNDSTSSGVFDGLDAGIMF